MFAYCCSNLFPEIQPEYVVTFCADFGTSHSLAKGPWEKERERLVGFVIPVRCKVPKARWLVQPALSILHFSNIYMPTKVNIFNSRHSGRVHPLSHNPASHSCPKLVVSFCYPERQGSKMTSLELKSLTLPGLKRNKAPVFITGTLELSMRYRRRNQVRVTVPVKKKKNGKQVTLRLLNNYLRYFFKSSCCIANT